jgi:hypothetical protein
MKKKTNKKKRYLLIMGIVAAAVLLSILFHTMLANDRPAIISLGAESEGVPPLGSCQIVCHAADPDGDDDELSYNWSADGGGITGDGATVTWTAPNSEGSYNIAVTVTDGHGGEVTHQVTITVSYQSSGPADRVEVVYFHRTQRCAKCIYAEDGTRYALETHFADELASGNVTFQVIDVEDGVNADIVNKYGAYTSSLFINTIKGGSNHIEQVTDIWLVIGDDEAFVEIVKNKIEKSLSGET